MRRAYVIRPAEAPDAPALSALKHATFRETFLEDFAIPYPADDLAVFEAQAYGVEAVTAELADPVHRTWVVDAPSGELAAYAHVGPCKLPHPDVHAGSGEIYQLYILRAHQGAGLGRRLMETALEWLEVHRPGPVWLGVWSGNARAQAVYARFGFQPVGTYEFAVGNHRDLECILKRG